MVLSSAKRRRCYSKESEMRSEIWPALRDQKRVLGQGEEENQLFFNSFLYKILLGWVK
jgi:hypothetical protein